MVAVYLALGFLFLYTDIAMDSFPVYRKPVGITMCVYAVIRTILTIKKNKNNKDEH